MVNVRLTREILVFPAEEDKISRSRATLIVLGLRTVLSTNANLQQQMLCRWVVVN